MTLYIEQYFFMDFKMCQIVNKKYTICCKVFETIRQKKMERLSWRNK